MPEGVQSQVRLAGKDSARQRKRSGDTKVWVRLRPRASTAMIKEESFQRSRCYDLLDGQTRSG
jgi:hypothetical protein